MRKLFKLVGEVSIAGINAVNGQMLTMDKKARKVQRSIAILGKNMQKTGMAMTKYISLPIAAAGAAVIKFGADFDKAMTSSLAIMGDVSKSMRKDMADAAREVAKKTRYSAKETAEAYYFLASAGLNASQSIKALPQVAAFAQAGLFDLSLATSLLTDAQSALGLKVEDSVQNLANMTRVSDVLIRVTSLADATTQEFAEALTNRAAAALQTLGKDVEEGVAVLAAFADKGIKGAEAGTKLDIVLRDLQTKAIKNKEAFKAAGIAVYDANGEMRNIADIVADLEDRFSGLSDEQKRTELMTLGFTDKSVAATVALLGSSDAIKEFEEKLRKAAGTTEEVADKQLQNFWDQLNLVKKELIDVGLTIWQALEPVLTNKLIPALKKAVIPIKKLAEWINNLDERSRDTILTLIAFAASYGPVLLILGKITVATKGLTTAIIAMHGALLANPFVLAGAAIASFILILKGIKEAYEDNIKAHQEWVALTTTQAQQDKFIKSTQNLIDKIIAQGSALKDVNDFTEMYGENIDELTEKARALGFVIEGDSIQKYQQLNNVLAFLNLTFDDTKKLVFRTREELEKANKEIAKTNTEVIKTNNNGNKSIKNNISLKKELIQQLISETDSLKAQESLKLRLYEIERKERIAKAKDTGESIAKINELYARKEKQLKKDTNDELKRLENKRAEQTKILIEKLEADRLKLIEKSKEKIKKFFTDWAKEEEKFTQEQVDKFWLIANSVSQIIGQMSSIVSQYYYNKNELLNQSEERERKNIENSIVNEDEREAAILKMEKKYELKRRKLQIEQAKKEKALAIFSATINAAAAVVSALTAKGPLTFKIVMASVIGALAAAQIALIAAAPIPKLKRGAYIKGGRGGIEAEIGEGAEDEMLLPMKTGVQALADALINKLNEIKLPIIKTPELAMAGGGTMTTGNNYKGGETHYHIGTLIADESGLKELQRRLNPYRIQDEQRMGRAYYGNR